MYYSNSVFSDRSYRLGDFTISNINKNALERYGINMSVNDFKNSVKTSPKYKVICTGGAGNFRHTKVYNYNDFVPVRQVAND